MELQLRKAALEKEATVKSVMAELSEKKPFKVTKVTKKERRRNPAAPFTTSSLQQDASNRLNFRTRKNDDGCSNNFMKGYHLDVVVLSV